MVLQVSVSLVLLVGAGLFLRTLENAYPRDLGFPFDQTLVAPVNLETRGYFEGGARGPDADWQCTNSCCRASRLYRASSPRVRRA